MLWGLLLQAKFTPGIISGTVPKDEAWWKQHLRHFIALLISIPAWQSQRFLHTLNASTNVYWQLFFNMTLTNVSFVFCWAFLADIINKNLGILELDPIKDDGDETETPKKMAKRGVPQKLRK